MGDGDWRNSMLHPNLASPTRSRTPPTAACRSRRSRTTNRDRYTLVGRAEFRSLISPSVHLGYLSWPLVTPQQIDGKGTKRGDAYVAQIGVMYSMKIHESNGVYRYRFMESTDNFLQTPDNPGQAVTPTPSSHPTAALMLARTRWKQPTSRYFNRPSGSCLPLLLALALALGPRPEKKKNLPIASYIVSCRVVSCRAVLRCIVPRRIDRPTSTGLFSVYGPVMSMHDNKATNPRLPRATIVNKWTEEMQQAADVKCNDGAFSSANGHQQVPWPCLDSG
ncbi:hypothetical protein EDB81DRAFT_164552 [Dactylonectria macrodidyma]|uniref:Uncharacterized protein n=1 Tax=Dactylonectria macrodidyma TaxID=307937 RepID=A0A9P9JGN4_9HYPO|nr:hypothetical protein EDB81DRAFT_164552 [Dactylonectria macrodidyma]